MTKHLAMFFVLMTAAGCGGAGQIASKPTAQGSGAEKVFVVAGPNGELRSIRVKPSLKPPPVIERLPFSARFEDPIAVMPNYPIPDPRRWPEKIVNGTRFHYIPVQAR